ncbi:MAG: protein translocase subunit SecD [Solobacterium sp.]|nr:protein translocase subunit SecD [Solobacterium sp.]
MKNKKGGLYGLFAIAAAIVLLVVSTFGNIRDNLNLGLDLQGGFEILYEVTPLNEGGTMDMTAVTNSIRKRIDVLGVNEPSIVVEGTDRVRVQLAGIADPETARQMLGTTANLTFRDIDDNELSDASIVVEGGASLAYQDGMPIVSLKIADAQRFGEITQSIAAKPSGQNLMVIWLDWEEGDSYREEAAKAAAGQEPKYISAASVNSQISGDCIIQGSFTDEEARTLANLINSGSLPVKLTEISSNVVSAQYGLDALSRTAKAGIIAVLLVAVMMIVIYRVEGILSALLLTAYIWAIFGVYALIGAVFTLPGIGALVLGVGMTVDANIITYERIRHQLYKGHSVRSAVAEGQKISFVTIFDAQFTTLLAALIMYWWGNGAVKGFATMLIITVFMTLVLNVGLSRLMLNLLVGSGVCDGHVEWFGVKKSQVPDIRNSEEQFYFGGVNFDFVSKAKLQYLLAGVVLAAGLAVSGINGANGNGFLNLGIDFSSGTKLTISADHAITIDEVRTEMDELGYTSFSYQAAGSDTVYATTKQSLTTDELATIKADFKDIYGMEPGDNVVTPVVGRELVRNAVILTLIAWVAMLLYITIRYQWDYALACLAALVHDVVITLAVFGILRLEVNTELISVLLTVIGYSINNSIVVCDRIRTTLNENPKLKKTDYKGVVNEALNSTFKVSMFSTISTMLPVVLLLILGSREIFTFTFAMFVGIVAGTLSSLFIAPTIWLYFRTHHEYKEKPKKKAYREELDEHTIKGINA